MKKIKYSILAGLVFAIIMFIYLLFTTKIDVAIVVSIFIFFVSPIIFYLKMFSKIELDEDFIKFDKDLIIYSGLASHFYDNITVGGTLYLLNDKLIFQTNILNFLKRHQTVIHLEKVASISFATSYYAINNALTINILGNNTEKFIVNNRELWKDMIEKQLDAKNLFNNNKNDF